MRPINKASLGIENQTDAQNILFRTGTVNRKNLAVTNSFIAFNQVKHPTLLFALNRVLNTFTGTARAEIGPTFLTNSVKAFCNKTIEYDLVHLSEDHCANLTTVGPDLVNPLRAGQERQQFRSNKTRLKNVEEWKEVLKMPQSIAIHTYSLVTHKKVVSKDPLLDVYSYLGPSKCPISFLFPKDMQGTYII